EVFDETLGGTELRRECVHAIGEDQDDTKTVALGDDCDLTNDKSLAVHPLAEAIGECRGVIEEYLDCAAIAVDFGDAGTVTHVFNDALGTVELRFDALDFCGPVRRHQANTIMFVSSSSTATERPFS